MYRITGHYPMASPAVLFPEIERQLAHGWRERWLAGGEPGPAAVTMTSP